MRGWHQGFDSMLLLLDCLQPGIELREVLLGCGGISGTCLRGPRRLLQLLCWLLRGMLCL